jgi:hypothetical protein
MRDVPGPEHDEWVRRMRALARRDAEEMVPRPDFPVFGLAAPALRPAALASFQQVNGSWAAVELAYGAWDAAGGPYVAVRSELADPEPAGAPGRGPEAALLRAVDAERNRVAAHAGVDDEEPAQPPRYSREKLPFGDVLVCRHGTVWTARLDGPAGVTVTITGRGTGPEEVRLQQVTDLRPLFEARNEILGRLAERRQREPPPDLEPAEGVAAFRALADFSLEGQTRIRGAVQARRAVRQPANWGRLHNALWQRAVREQQRIAGVDKRAADEVVTSVINHLGHLAERAPWFITDTPLREAAIDETLRHAVLGENVPSLPAQQAWARYWAQHMAGLGRDPADVLAELPARRSLTDDWLAAWAAWAATA